MSAHEAPPGVPTAMNGRTDEPARVGGYDLARAGAIVGMVLINFQVYLLAPPSGAPSSAELRWLAHLPSGRASALFVTLAGAGISLMAARAAAPRKVVRTLLLRALFLLIAGNLLKLVWSIDILHFYAFYLALAALAFRLPSRALLSLAGLLALAGGALRVGAPWVAELDEPYWSPAGMALDVFLDGVHPVVPWFSFVLVGLWLGRRDLRDRAIRNRLMVGGAAVALGAEFASLALGATVPRLWPDASLDWMRVLGTRWSPHPLYVLGASGSSVFFICLAQAAVERWRSSVAARALIATGQLAFTVYVLHALVGVGVPRWLLGLEDQMSLGAVAAYWLLFVLATIGLASLLRAYFRVGPLEWVLRRVAPSPVGAAPAVEASPPVSTPTSPAPDPSRPAPSATRKLAWSYLGLILFAVVIARHTGVAPPLLGCDRPATLPANGAVASELSLTCASRDGRLVVERRAEVTLETSSGQDLYLELYRGEQRIAEDDDSGRGLDARLVQTLEPGAYRVRVRPYASATGAYALVVSQQSTEEAPGAEPEEGDE